jgi:hypothetical protein
MVLAPRRHEARIVSKIARVHSFATPSLGLSRPLGYIAIKLVPTWIPEPIQPLARIGRTTAPFASIGRHATLMVRHVGEIPDCAGLVPTAQILQILGDLVGVRRVVAGMDCDGCARFMSAVVFVTGFLDCFSPTFLYRC